MLYIKNALEILYSKGAFVYFNKESYFLALSYSFSNDGKIKADVFCIGLKNSDLSKVSFLAKKLW